MISVQTYSDWQNGSFNSTEAISQYGVLKLQSAAQTNFYQVGNDEFDTSFLKYYWNLSATSTSVLAPFSNGQLNLINLDGNSNIGIISFASYSLATTNGRFETLITPNNSAQNWGGLFLEGADPSPNGFVQISFATSGTLSSISSVNPIPIQTVIYGNSAFLGISKTSSSYYTYFRALTATSWSPLATYSSLTLAAYNFRAGLGTLVPSYSGSASYDYVHLTPYSPSGTWTSATLDRGGIPATPGLISWQASTGLSTTVQIQTQTSADGISWSGWSNVYNNPNGSTITSPLNRYLRVQASLATSDTSQTPALYNITINQPDFSGALLSDSGVKIVPNPVRSNTAIIQYSLAASASSLSLQFMDTSNRQIWQDNGPANQGLNTYPWDVSSQANGVYFVKISAVGTDGSKFSVVKKIVILR